jgi:tRNA(Ile)-lysidine synthase
MAPASPIDAVMRALRDALAQAAPRRATAIAVGLSGGRDSIVLLDALAALAAEAGIALSALHVHHGLSPNADAWAAFCLEECAKRQVTLDVHRAHVERTRGASLEATARAARHAAFAKLDVDFVALAHHADDQAETLLLQLLRGAGPHGLAAMPLVRRSREGPSLLRPFVALPRQTIEAYAQERSLRWIDDESNADTRLKRNFVRHEIAPRLKAGFKGYPATLARAASHQAEAALLLDALASLDAEAALGRDASGGMTLDRAKLTELAADAPHRARNLLRWFLRQHELRAPSAARLAAMLGQLAYASGDARVRLVHAGVELGIHRSRVVVHAPAVAPFAIAWQGEPWLELPHGNLEFQPCEGGGMARDALTGAAVTVRSRIGGERIRLAADRPRQALKRVLQAAALPAWQRESLPLVFCGASLAAIPGIGVDAAFQAPAGALGYNVRWHPHPGKG